MPIRRRAANTGHATYLPVVPHICAVADVGLKDKCPPPAIPTSATDADADMRRGGLLRTGGGAPGLFPFHATFWRKM